MGIFDGILQSWANQGSAIDPIAQFQNKLKRYPGNNKQWWVARAEADDDDKKQKAGDFLPEVLDKLFYGNTQAPRGHFILNAFYKDRASTSRVSGIPIEITKQRPTSIAFYGGRVWFGCNSTVYFSQLLTERYRAGLCYQEADPTSENISDLIATDGGVIPIPEISRIIRMVPNGNGILILATNGVWSVTGTDSGFSALDFSVNKVSPVGCKSPMSVVETEGGIFWWSDIGIMGMQEKLGMYGPIPGAFDRSNISQETIQSFYNEIDEAAREEVKAIFDARNNRIMWLYRDADVGPNQYNRVLLYDITLQAFYPWKFSNLATNSPKIKGIFLTERLNVSADEEDVVVTGVAVEAGGDEVVVDKNDISRYPSSVEYLCMQGTQGRFAQTTNTNFVDWEQANGVGVTYNSFVEAGYELFDDAMRRKELTYVLTYLRRTENSFDPVTLELDDPSSCFMTVKWDWASSAASNKWSTPVQIYRPGRFLAMNPPDYDTGFPIVVTKNKVRGHGKAIQFRFGTDERNRNFDLHGWSVAVTGETSP
jgi:hypothetical protein